MPSKPRNLPTDRLHVRPWPDSVIDTVGHDPRSPYVERFWLGVLGPSTTWLLRHLTERLEREPAGYTAELAPLAARLGLRTNGGQNSTLLRSLGRLVRFELATMQGRDTLCLRTKVPSLSLRHTSRFDAELQAEHEEWVRAELEDSA